MRRLAILVSVVLTAGLYGATATASPNDTVPMRPAPTSVDHVTEVSCEPPEPPAATAAPGATTITFTLLPAGCPIP